MIEDDAELLRQYARDRSQAAFAELVRRHINLVYSVALRQLAGDTHLAEDAVQKVFSALALKAARLDDRVVLAGWLYRSAQFEASKLVRTEQRRRQREKEASLMDEITHDSAGPTDWEKIRPLLDQTMAELGASERDALVLRFLEGRPFAEIGARLQVTENAARMRVERALDKLHGLLSRRGVTSTTAALGVAMAGQAALAAPAGLALSVSGVAVSGAAATAGSIGLLTFLAMNKLPIGLTSALAVASVSSLVVQQRGLAKLREDLAHVRSQNLQIDALQQEKQRVAQQAAEVERLRGDDAELARLSAELATLKGQLSEQAKARAQAEALAAAKRAQERAAVSTTNGQTLDLSGLDRVPSPRTQAAPVYPAALRQAGLEGTVVVSFIVDAQGNVQGAKPVQFDVRVSSAPSPDDKAVVTEAAGAFGKAAVEAIEQWKFAPGQKSGRMVNTRMNVPVVFSTAKGPQTGDMKVGDTNAPAVAPNNWF